MNPFDPDTIAQWAKGTWKDTKLPESVAGFCFDARNLKPGECFIALSCGVRDGHEFVEQAVEKGAGSLMLERPQTATLPQLIVNDSLAAMGRVASEIRKRFAGPIAGITGSCGKTSTKEMLRTILGEGQVHATPGNWNNLIGVPMTLFELNGEEHSFAVIEAGINQRNEMSRLGSIINADLTIITNIGPAHLELLGSLENIAAEKSFLVEHSKTDAPVILPNAAFKYPAFSKYADRSIVLAEEGESVHGEPRQMVRFKLEISGFEFSRLTMSDGKTVQNFEIASPSRGVCTNAALAVIAARHLGITDAEIKKRLAGWVPSSNRGCIVRRNEQAFYIDCYNANPASMSDSLAAFHRSMPTGQPRFYVIGTMNELGENAINLHRQVGMRIKLDECDRIIFVGDGRFTAAYVDGAVEAGVSLKQIKSVTDAEAIKSEIANFSGNIFLKGSRSHQLEKILPAPIIEKLGTTS